jgi:hypothetical protein
MFPNKIPQFNLDGLIFFGKNSGGDFCIDGFDYLDPSNVGGPSQTYLRVDVIGGLNSCPDYIAPLTALVFPDLANGSYPNWGKSRCVFQCLLFKDSLFNLRICLPILPGCTHTPLVTTDDPSLPSSSSLILGGPRKIREEVRRTAAAKCSDTEIRDR